LEVVSEPLHLTTPTTSHIGFSDCFFL
jgi:hypothetical protein